MDLLFPDIGELVGGSERIEDSEQLIESMTQSGLDPAKYEWYIDLRR